VLDKSLADPTTRAIDQFNKMIQADQRVNNMMLPIRDGLMIIQKK
jgi:predicted O-methyltransferase YrrM